MTDNSATDTWISRVRERIAELGLTPTAFARSIGMSQPRFANYLRGTREPAFADLMVIVSALGVSADWVLFGGNRPSPLARSTLAAQIEALPTSARRDIEGYLRVHRAAGGEQLAPNNSFKPKPLRGSA